jgi:heme-degrading monooxygenase HmoA
MIARIWHGRTSLDHWDTYYDFLIRRAVPDYESVPGNRGVYILREQRGGEAHFLTLTFWESEDAIRQFAGEDIRRAKYYPEDADFLLEFEPEVRHYEVFSSPGSPAGG